MKADLRDFALRDIGCIVCLHRGVGATPCEKHHLLTSQRHGTGKRRGERFTVGLCTYHHRGVGTPTAALGPSYAREPRHFRALYSDDWLLTEQNRLIAGWQKNTIGAAA